MAGDWIKMRPALLTSPKINGMARVLESKREVSQVLTTGFSGAMNEIVTRNVMRNVVIASLLIVWGAANEHTEDGVFVNADLSDIDDMVGIPFFGEAMQSVGWAEYDEEEFTVTLPNFSEYNTCGKDRAAEKAAERQKKYRENKKNNAVKNDVTRDVTNDVTRDGREEKRREEVNNSKKSKFNFLGSLVASGVPVEVADDYLQTRKAKKCVQTETAFNGLAAEAKKAGLSLADAAALCCKRGWGGFEASWIKPEDAPKATVHAMPSIFAGAR